MKQVTIYTDGFCLDNPGRGGYGAVLIYGQHRKELLGGYRLTTNNRMELMAAIKGLQALKKPCEVTLHSDSKYLVEPMADGRVKQWQAGGWRRKKRRIKNVDLWEQLLEGWAPLSPTSWVAGTCGSRSRWSSRASRAFSPGWS